MFNKLARNWKLWFALLLCQNAVGEDWVCMPEQITIGQWKIEIRSDQATTSYMPDIAPNIQPFRKTIPVERLMIGEDIHFLAADFQIVIRPGEAPLRNPFFPEKAVAADLIYVRFADNAYLENRAYVCKDSALVLR